MPLFAQRGEGQDIVHTAIFEGDPLFREGLRRILEGTRYQVDVSVPSLAEVIEHVGRLDLMLVLGFSDSDLDSVDALKRLRAERPEARFVAIADNRAIQLIVALKAGFDGYLVRHISSEALLRFLSLIMLGQRVFSTRSLDLPNADAIDERAMQGYRVRRIDSSALTGRDQALMGFLVEGQSNKAIARELGIAETTVKAQMVRLFGKIGAANRTQAAVLAWAAHRPSALEPSRA